jgi:general stress protein 26
MKLEEKILGVMGGVHVGAVATIWDGRPAVRFMALTGNEDLSLVGGTMKDSRKVEQIKKNPHAAISIWSCREFTDPYVVVEAEAHVHEDIPTKKRYWDPVWKDFFKSPENPEWVVLRFVPVSIEYYDREGMEVWK